MAYQWIGIDHVQLAAPSGCEPEARQFYGDLLGWPEVTKPSELAGRGGVWFLCGQHQVHIGVQQAFQPAKKAHPGFRVKNLDSLRTHLMAHGVSLIDDSARAEEGMARVFLEDPFGNRIEFIEGLSCL